METSLVVAALMALGLVGAFTVGVLWGRRSTSSGEKQPTRSAGEAAPPPSAEAEYDDHMEIPAALIGARCKEVLDHFAPILGVKPGNLLRAAAALSRAADWSDSIAPQQAPAPEGGKVLPFSRKISRRSEPDEAPPSGERDHIETLADVIRLTAHALPTDSKEAAIRAIASLFREDPRADMDRDSGPIWIATINHFLQSNPRATMDEIAAEFNRRVDDEEAPLTPIQVSPVTTPPNKTEKS